MTNILDLLVFNEAAYTHRELNDLESGRFFKEYKHNESADLASRKLESKLRSVNPESVVIRQDPYHFVMVHPGGDLVTTAETTDAKHMVATHHVSPFARDFKKETEKSSHNVLYENEEEQFENSSLYEEIHAVRSDYLVHDSNGKVFFRHKNMTILKHAIANMQQHYFHDNVRSHHVEPHNLEAHKLHISSRDEYIRKFGSGELHHPIPHPPISEEVVETHEVHYSHITKGDGQRVSKKMKINFAIDKDHAVHIAHRIARKRKLNGFRIHHKK